MVPAVLMASYTSIMGGKKGRFGGSNCFADILRASPFANVHEWKSKNSKPFKSNCQDTQRNAFLEVILLHKSNQKSIPLGVLVTDVFRDMPGFTCSP